MDNQNGKNCRETVFEMVEDVTEKLGSGYFLDSGKYEQLGEACDLVDELLKELTCKGMEISVHDDKSVIFSILCNELIIEGELTCKFLMLLDFLDSVQFVKAGEDILQINLTFDGLWQRDVIG